MKMVGLLSVRKVAINQWMVMRIVRVVVIVVRRLGDVMMMMVRMLCVNMDLMRNVVKIVSMRYVVVDGEALEHIESRSEQMRVVDVVITDKLETLPLPGQAVFVEGVCLVLQLLLCLFHAGADVEVVVCPQDVVYR